MIIYRKNEILTIELEDEMEEKTFLSIIKQKPTGSMIMDLLKIKMKKHILKKLDR